MRLTGWMGLLVWIFVVVVLFISAAGRSTERNVGPPCRLFPDGSEIEGHLAKILNGVILEWNTEILTDKLSKLNLDRTNDEAIEQQTTSERENLTEAGDAVQATEISSDDDRLAIASSAPSNFANREYVGKITLEDEPRVVHIPNEERAQGDLWVTIMGRLQRYRVADNITRYYNAADTEGTLELRFQPAECQLADWLADTQNSLTHLNKLDPILLMKEVAEGIKHAHDSGIVHRNITPQTIDLSLADFNNNIRAMVGDFRNGQIIEEPNADSQNLLAGDIRALASVFNEMLKKIDHCDEEGPNNCKCRLFKRITALDLIWKMLRVTGFSIHNVLEHPLFWSSKQFVDYWQEKSDILEGLRKKPTIWKKVSKILESQYEILFGKNSWQEYLPDSLLVTKDQKDAKTKKRPRPNYGHELDQFFRLIRNMAHHFYEKTGEVKKIIRSVPDGLCEYINTKFAHFAIIIYNLWPQIEGIINNNTLPETESEA